jgi:signal transduction histidine kinase
MSSVLFSLLDNAIYSLHEKFLLDINFKPKLTINTYFYKDFMEIRVCDNGKGISDVDKKQLFSPFFTTKPTSKGTGLGLFISQDIIRTHKGNISIDTEQDSFTTFIIQLPISVSLIN